MTMKSSYDILATYEAGSNTIRKVPENYCLISFLGSDEQPEFDVDHMVTAYQHLVKQAYGRWLLDGNKSKIRLAADISIALKNYNPFAQYPSWHQDDVFNAIRMLIHYDRHRFVDFNLEHQFRALLNEQWEAEKSGKIQESKLCKDILNVFVAHIYTLYQLSFPVRDQYELEVNVVIPIRGETVLRNAPIFVGPHSREEAEAFFYAHTGVPYWVYEQSSDPEALLRPSDSIGTYIVKKTVAL